jgi:uncharacterized protein YndB with AHSA1/START domain
MPTSVVLVVRRVIHAGPERLFDAWTQPAHLRKWWGPQSVVCTAAEVDLRVGGTYRIANQFPDGKVLWITGEFEAIDRPRRLVYTWRLSAQTEVHERVTVEFLPCGPDDTEVIITHERIRDVAVRDMHEQGWRGCLDGLMKYVESAA